MVSVQPLFFKEKRTAREDKYLFCLHAKLGRRPMSSAAAADQTSGEHLSKRINSKKKTIDWPDRRCRPTAYCVDSLVRSGERACVRSLHLFSSIHCAGGNKDLLPLVIILTITCPQSSVKRHLDFLPSLRLFRGKARSSRN